MGEGEKPSVLVVTEKADLFKDVQFALFLVDMKVTEARSIRQAKEALVELAHDIVISAFTVEEEKGAALRLLSEMRELPEFARIPFICLCTTAEESMAAASQDARTVKLPIVFPLFTQQVEEILAESMALADFDAPSFEEVRIDPLPEQPLEEILPSFDEKVPLSVQEKREIVEKVLALVMEEVEPQLEGVQLQELPKVLSRALDRVCTELSDVLDG